MRKKVNTLIKEAKRKLKNSRLDGGKKSSIMATLDKALAHYKIENCRSCKATGKCTRCNGTGTTTSCAFDGQPQWTHECYVCHGTRVCQKCKTG